MLRRAFRRASARCSAHGGAAVGMRSGCPPHAHGCNVLNKGDAETPKNGFRTPPINYRNSSPRCLHTRLNAKFGKSPQSTKFSRRKLRESSLIYARAPRESCCHHRRAEKRTPCRCTEKNGAGTNSLRRKKVGWYKGSRKNIRIRGKSRNFHSIGQIFLPKNAGSIAYSGESCASAAQQLPHRRRTQPHRLGDFGRTPPVGVQQHHTPRLRAQSRERTRPPRIQHPRIVEGRTRLSRPAPHRRPQPPRLRAVKTGARKPRVPTF